MSTPAERTEEAADFLGGLPEDDTAIQVWTPFNALLDRLEAEVEVESRAKTSKSRMTRAQEYVDEHPSLNAMPRYKRIIQLYGAQKHLDDREEVLRKWGKIVFEAGREAQALAPATTLKY